MALTFPHFSIARLVLPNSGPAVRRLRVGFNQMGFKGAAALSLGIILAFVLAACEGPTVSTNSSSTTSPGPAPTAGAADPITPSSTTTKPGTTETTSHNPNDFTFTLYQGQERLGAESLNLSDLLGKPVILNFWAGLCGPCRAELPEFQEFYDEYQDRVVLLGIDVGQFTWLGNQDDAQALLQTAEVTYPSGFTEEPAIMRNFRIFGIPTTVFISSQGEIFQKYDSVLTSKTLSEITDKMLSQEAG